MTDEGSDHDASLSLPMLEHIDAVCTDFETAWQAVEPPQINDYLGQAQGVERSELLRELLRLEIDYRRLKTREASSLAFQRRFPEEAQLIDSVFREFDRGEEPGMAPWSDSPADGAAATSGSDPASTLVEGDDPNRNGGRCVGDSSTGDRRFRIKRFHARGGLGELFVAYDRELHREVALKEIQAKHAHNLVGQSRFALEAEVTGRLEHPGIVPVYSMGTHSDGRPFYAMRFIRGRSLQQAIEEYHGGEKGRAASECIIEFRKLLGRFVSVCQTIEYAHSRGVVHRDVKPSNIMLGKYGETLVVDWGLAKVTGQVNSPADSSPNEPALIPRLTDGGSADTAVGAAIGTPAYMSPEQTGGNMGEVGLACDVYSLGTTLYTILAGRAPFAGNNASDILRCVQAGEFAPPRTHRPDTPRALEAICLKAMALDPSDRYESARGLADDVEAWLADERVSAYRETTAARIRRWVRRRQAPVMATTAAVVMAIIGLCVGNVILAGKNRELQIANKDIDTARGRADRRFALALEAIENYHTGVSQDVLLKQPELNGLRNKLLRGSLEFYEKLRGDLEPAQDPQSRSALAKAYCAMARTCRQIGDYERALHSYQKAIEVQEGLADEAPELGEYHGHLAESLRRLGFLYIDMKDFKSAGSALERARTIEERLVAEFPDESEHRSNLAEIYDSLVMAEVVRKDPDRAFEYRQRAVRICEALAAEWPDDSELQCRLARTYSNFAVLLKLRGDYQEAQRTVEKAITIHQKEADRYPGIPEHECDLAKYYELLAALHSRGGDQSAALRFDERAAQIRERLSTEYPNVLEFQSDLVSSYQRLRALHRAGGRADQTQAYLQKESQVREFMAAGRPRNEELQRSYVMSLVRNADFLLSHGQPQKALTYQQIAVRTQAKLAQQWPANQAHQVSLGRWHLRLAEIQHQLGTLDEALESYLASVRILEELAEPGPAERRFLANALHSLGALQLGMGDRDAAHQSYQQTVKLRESVAKDAPDDKWNRFGVMCVYHDLAKLYRRSGKMSEAEAAFETAVRFGEELVVDAPQADRYAVELGDVYSDRGHFARDSELPDSSVEWYAKAIRTLQSVIQRDGGQHDARRSLYKAHRGRAASLTRLGRYSESIADWEEAIALAPASRAGLQMQLARTRALAQDHATAASEAVRLAAASEASGETHYVAACVLALSTAAAECDTTLDEKARNALAARYAREAINALTNARDLGYFGDQRCREKLNSDEDLAAIRKFEAFQDWLKESE